MVFGIIEEIIKDRPASYIDIAIINFKSSTSEWLAGLSTVELFYAPLLKSNYQQLIQWTSTCYKAGKAARSVIGAETPLIVVMDARSD